MLEQAAARRTRRACASATCRRSARSSTKSSSRSGRRRRSPKEALDASVSRGDELLRRFEKSGSSAGSRRRRVQEHRCPDTPGRSLSASGIADGKAVSFQHRACCPYLLVAPQLAITGVVLSVARRRGAAGKPRRARTRSARRASSSGSRISRSFSTIRCHLASFNTTLIFCALVTVSGLVISLLLAACADRVTRGAKAYQTLPDLAVRRRARDRRRAVVVSASIRASGS